MNSCYSHPELNQYIADSGEEIYAYILRHVKFLQRKNNALAEEHASEIRKLLIEINLLNKKIEELEEVVATTDESDSDSADTPNASYHLCNDNSSTWSEIAMVCE